MKCVICKHGETVAGHTTVTLERNGMTLVFKNVPGRVCDNCGERYVDESVTELLLKTAKQAASAGVQVDVRQYVGSSANTPSHP